MQWQGNDLENTCIEIESLLEERYKYSGAYFLYSEEVIRKRISYLVESLPRCTFFYSVKSLSNIHILEILHDYERVGLDVVSAGEILRAISAGFEGNEMVFAGVGKSEKEIILGLQKEIKSFHVESLAEIKNIARIAASIGKTARIALRVNPDIAVNTHKYITTAKDENKFGISKSEISEAINLVTESSSLRLNGLQIHLGSQIKEVGPYIESLKFMLKLREEYANVENIDMEYFSLGGGFGIDYNRRDDSAPEDFPVAEFYSRLQPFLEDNIKIALEPGRFISAYSGLLISKILYLKEKKNFTIAICNSGMTELIRPALYEAHHPILPLVNSGKEKTYDIVGPVCESADFFALKRKMSELIEGSRLAVLHAGAYGSVMSSNYNTRPLVPEVLLTAEGSIQIIRKPQSVEQILELEAID